MGQGDQVRRYQGGLTRGEGADIPYLPFREWRGTDEVMKWRSFCCGAYVADCEGFRMPAADERCHAAWAAGVGKPPREETARSETRAVGHALWGLEWRECCA